MKIDENEGGKQQHSQGLVWFGISSWDPWWGRRRWVPHLASICFTVPVIWFIFSSKREMVSLFCLELASELCGGHVRRCSCTFEHPPLTPTAVLLGVLWCNRPTCDLWSSCWLMARRSSSCCRSSIRASCFSHMSFSSIFMDISISCFIPICTSSSFSTSCSS